MVDESKRLLSVTVQIDFVGAVPAASAQKVADVVDAALHDMYRGLASSHDWWFLRIEEADPGDIDDPEWEVIG